MKIRKKLNDKRKRGGAEKVGQSGIGRKSLPLIVISFFSWNLPYFQISLLTVYHSFISDNMKSSCLAGNWMESVCKKWEVLLYWTLDKPVRPKCQFCLWFFLSISSRMRASITKSPSRRRSQARLRGWPWCSPLSNVWQDFLMEEESEACLSEPLNMIYIINNRIMLSSPLWDRCIHCWDSQYFNQKS